MPDKKNDEDIGYILIDTPVGPYSPIEETERWIEELKTYPDRPGVKESIDEAQEILTWKKEP